MIEIYPDLVVYLSGYFPAIIIIITFCPSLSAPPYYWPPKCTIHKTNTVLILSWRGREMLPTCYLLLNCHDGGENEPFVGSLKWRKISFRSRRGGEERMTGWGNMGIIVSKERESAFGRDKCFLRADLCCTCRADQEERKCLQLTRRQESRMDLSVPLCFFTAFFFVSRFLRPSHGTPRPTHCAEIRLVL